MKKAKRGKKYSVEPPASTPVQKGKASRGSFFEDVSISKRGRKVILLGLGMVVLGYIVLTQANPEGSNWAAVVAPFFLLLGYATIGIGILL
jgi:hypothetical protein